MQGHLEDCRLPLSLHSAQTGRQWSGHVCERMRKYSSPAGYSSPHPALSRQVDDSTREKLGFLKLSFPACLTHLLQFSGKMKIIQHPLQLPLSTDFPILSWPANLEKTLGHKPGALPQLQLSSGKGIY